MRAVQNLVKLRLGKKVIRGAETCINKRVAGTNPTARGLWYETSNHPTRNQTFASR